MSFSTLVLGSSSAIPTQKRRPSSQLVNIDNKLFLVDCGEGAQLQLRKYKVKFQRINHIFITHLHGDHYLGLMGLISTMHLLGRQNTLNIYGPPALEEIIRIQLKHSQSYLRYELIFHPVPYDKSKIVYEDENLSVATLVLNHRINCTGYLFKEKKKPRNLNKAKADEYGVPIEMYKNLKAGEDYINEDGETIPNKELTFDPPQPLSFAYCSDTAFHEPLIDQVKDVDLLYHEATFLEEHRSRAKETKHSTAKQAAEIALKAKARKLIIGHFSNRYTDLNRFKEETAEIFKNTELALEGEVFQLRD